jgi:hypothetical protein
LTDHTDDRAHRNVPAPVDVEPVVGLQVAGAELAGGHHGDAERADPQAEQAGDVGAVGFRIGTGGARVDAGDQAGEHQTGEERQQGDEHGEAAEVTRQPQRPLVPGVGVVDQLALLALAMSAMISARWSSSCQPTGTRSDSAWFMQSSQVVPLASVPRSSNQAVRFV